MKRYLLHLIIGFDQFVNTLIGGYPDETISARCWRHRNQFGWKQMRWFLDNILLRWDTFNGMSHCEWANWSEENKIHFSEFYKK